MDFVVTLARTLQPQELKWSSPDMTSIASRTALLKAVLAEPPEADAVIAHVMGGMEPAEQPPAELVTKAALANQRSPSPPKHHVPSRKQPET
jgi:hypothetical protein